MVLSAGIEPASAPSEGAILSVERREQYLDTILHFVWCSRQESNLYCQLRKLVSYPLNDESEVMSPTILPHRRYGRGAEQAQVCLHTRAIPYCISESKQSRHKVVEAVLVLFLLHVMQEVGIDHIGIDVFEWNYEMR